MSLILDCRSCGRKLRMPEDLLGQQVQCPSCRSTFEAIMPPAEMPLAAPAANPPAAAPTADVQIKLTLDDEPPAPPRAEPTPVSRPLLPPVERSRQPEDWGPANCPSCGESISPNATRCRFCGVRLDVYDDRPLERQDAYGMRRDCESHRGS